MMGMPRPRRRRMRRKRRSMLARCRLLVGSSLSNMRRAAARGPARFRGGGGAAPAAWAARKPQRAGARARVDLSAAEFLEQLPGAGVERIALQHERRAFRAEKDVLGDGEMRAERELLVDVGDAASPRVDRGRGRVRRAVDRHRAGVGAEKTGEDVEQRALAGAVLADERVHFAGTQAEVHAVEGDCRAETLREAAQLENHSRYCSSGGCSNCCDAGVSGGAGVINVTPGSMRLATGLPSRWSTSVFTPRSPMRKGFWTTTPSSFRSRMARTKMSLESKPRKRSLPALPASSSASSAPAVDDSFGVKTPSISWP